MIVKEIPLASSEVELVDELIHVLFVVVSLNSVKITERRDSKVDEEVD